MCDEAQVSMNVPGLLIEGQDLDLPKNGEGALSIIDLAADRKYSTVNLDIMQSSRFIYSTVTIACSARPCIYT